MLSSGQLQVTLSNTSIMGAASPGDVLTAVYFDAPDVTVTPLSASANMGSIKNCIICPNGTNNVSGEWAYAATGATHLISATDFGFLKAANLIGPTNLSGTIAPGGVDFSIVSNAARLNQPGLVGTPVVINQVIFRFDAPANMETSAIGAIGFLFGPYSYYTANRFDGSEAPEPATFALIGMGLVAARIRTAAKSS